MMVELDRKEAWYIRALVAREKVNVQYSNKVYKKAFGKDSDEFTDEIELCNSILSKLDQFFTKERRIYDAEMREVQQSFEQSTLNSSIARAGVL